jgi:ubiquinone/menaquinone biosynthesis C-methylase UbiE
MRNQKCQETRTTSIALGKAGQLTDPYRRHEGRMDRSLLQQEVEFANHALGHAAQGGTLLDLCCATGEVSPMLQIPGFRSLGLDINLLALAAFRQHLLDVPLVQGDALQLPFGDESLDAIVAIHCFDLLDRVGFIQECNRVLRCGGLLIFDALNRHSYKLILKRLGRFLGPLFAGRLSDKWIDVFSCQEVLQLVGRAGLDLQAIHGYGWPPFSVSSNSRLVNATISVERVLLLNRLPRVSPRILVAVRKKAKKCAGLRDSNHSA